MDINLKRRALEKAIAREAAQAVFAILKPIFDAAKVTDAAEAGRLVSEHQASWAHAFGRVCDAHRDDLKDEAAIKRVFEYVPGELAAMNRDLGKLAKVVDQAADEAERAARWLPRSSGKR
jgi:hypothetical protein